MSGSLTDRGNSQHFRVLVELFSTLFDTQVTERKKESIAEVSLRSSVSSISLAAKLTLFRSV